MTDDWPGRGLAQSATTPFTAGEEIPAREAERRGLLRIAMCYLAAAALVIVFFSPRLIERSALWMGDSLHLYVPYRVFVTNRLHAGRLPQWADQLVGGFPILSDPQSGTFFPLNLALAATVRHAGSSAVMDPFHLLTVMLLALGGVFLARSFGLGSAGALACSIVVAFNGFTITHLGQLSILQTQTAGVWFLGALVRALRHASLPWSFGAGLLLASTILAGHPQMALFICYAGLAGGLLLALHLCVSRRSWKLLAISGGLGLTSLAVGVLGSLVQTLPTGTYLAHASRHFGAMTAAMAMNCSLPPKQLPGLLMPGLYSPYPLVLGPDERWKVLHEIGGETIYACGIVAMCLAVLALLIRRRSLPVLALFLCMAGLLVATLGRHTPLYPAMYRYVPGFDNMRFPSRLFGVFFVGTGLLAGVGLDSVTKSLSCRSKSPEAYVCTVLIGAVLLAGVLFLLAARVRCGDWAMTFELLFQRDCWYSRWELLGKAPERIACAIATQLAVGCAFALACIVWLARVGNGQVRPALAGTVVVALLFAELWGCGFQKNVRTGFDGYRDMESPLFGALDEASVAGRVLVCDPPKPVPANTALGTRISYANGYQGILLNHVSSFLPPETLGGGARHLERLFDLSNVSTLMAPRRDFAGVLNGRPVTLPDAGWIELASADGNLSSSLEWNLETTTAPVRLSVFVALAASSALTSATPLGILALEGRAGDVLASSPLRLGAEVNLSAVPMASLAELRRSGEAAFSRKFTPVTVEVPTSTVPERMRVTCCAPQDVRLLVSHLVSESSGTVTVQVARECLGERLRDTRSPDWRVLARSTNPGYAWLVPHAEVVPSRESDAEVRAMLCAADFDVRSTVLLHPDGEPVPMAGDEREELSGNVADVRLDGEHVSMRTSSNRPCWLVVSAAFYPGWSAWIDGRPTPLLRANGFMRALHVPEGSHTVTMDFVTPGLQTGGWASLATWLVCAVFLLLRTVRAVVCPRQSTP